MPWQLEAKKDVVACEKRGGVGKRALIPRCLNGATRPARVITEQSVRRTWRTETSKYPEEKKSTEIPSVVASESGKKPKSMIAFSGMDWKVQPQRVKAPYTKSAFV